MTRDYQMCTRTVMDTSDPTITFDEDGVSSHFHHARARLANEYFPGPDGERRIEELAARIRSEGEGKPYDCIMGVSGGADSSYVAIRAKELGLRPLAVHLDNGWNTDTAVSNIELLLRELDIDLFTHVMDWEEFKDIQRSLFLASVPNIEVATDHAITALLFHKAAEHNVRYLLSGSNVETESILPRAWGHDNRDWRSIKAIKRRFGNPRIGMESYPHLTPIRFLDYLLRRKIRFVPVLNYGGYNKAKAVKVMQQRFGYNAYARKHGESRFTRFFQEYYLPEKFGFDKRRAHFSSMIASDTMTREEALVELERDMYDPVEKMIDIEYCSRKLGFSAEEWAEVMATPPAHATDYPNNGWLFDHTTNRATALVRKIAKGEMFARKRSQS
ncbi:N-acetyl sugar amidotransferase [Erythrobacter litoralis]|uniref:Putative LPS biosynthesis protein WbpG n=1 Tax=Erythrobacter litoralis (strain HTCC2594) TaxID=314225 RepID=Q2N6D6_ERYLH|nr:N-acetyl sugar amidotransferase [Erythrobacter litoralis]ABC64755.1 putative LPS biosynthesis protein WbpG [Erythrobacter litoralis HTCC2594]